MKWKPWQLISALSLLGAFFVVSAFSFFSSKHVPAEFSEARIKGANIAEEIIAQQAFTLRTLDEIALLDKAQNAPEALILISKELIKNRETGIKAIQLSSQLEKMAFAIISIRPSRARETVTAAITAEIGLVSRLLTYNNYLAQLFEVLENKFSNENAQSDSSQVRELINKINDEVNAINDLDKKFNEGLQKFDEFFVPQRQ